MNAFRICTLASLLQFAYAQSLAQAISGYTELTEFSNLLSTNPSLASGLLSDSANSDKTVLIPNNAAFAAYQQQTGQGLGSASATFLQPFLQYHVLDGSYGAESFTPEDGATIPTLLTGEIYNNRSAGAALSSVAASSGDGDNNGQVVFAAPQVSGSPFIQSGLASRVNLTATNGTFDGGRFHILDGALTLPRVCTETIRNQGLSSLLTSLDRTGLSPVLDTLSNVTCLAPNNAAFLTAGSPDTKLDVTNLTGALMFHTIPQPLYSNFLESGQTYTTASNDTVRITIRDGDIYFNDAKVLKPNVLTNNGLIHVLDRIMSPLSSDAAQNPGPSNSTGSAKPSATTSATSSATTFAQVPTSDGVRSRMNILLSVTILLVVLVVGLW